MASLCVRKRRASGGNVGGYCGRISISRVMPAPKGGDRAFAAVRERRRSPNFIALRQLDADEACWVRVAADVLHASARGTHAEPTIGRGVAASAVGALARFERLP